MDSDKGSSREGLFADRVTSPVPGSRPARSREGYVTKCETISEMSAKTYDPAHRTEAVWVFVTHIHAGRTTHTRLFRKIFTQHTLQKQ